MIRFACGTCGRSLRAPVGLAGKRGRCARCGAVNSVPAALLAPRVVSVDVKRSSRQSPFRSTADLEPAGAALQGAIEVSGARFLATGEAAAVPEHSRDFFEPAPIRIVQETVPIEGEEWHEPRARAGRRGGRANGGGGSAANPLPPHPAYDLHFDHRANEVWRAIVAALLVGGVVGFCLGLFACKWIT